MQKTKLLLGTFVVMCCSGFALSQMMSPPAAKTPGGGVNAVIAIAESEFVGAADAMPEDKYSFAPSAGDFKGVRTYGEQVKHVAAVNYIFGAAILGEKPPAEAGGENGPDSVKSKAQIMEYLKGSFAYLHKAVASITAKNELDTVSLFGGSFKLSRIGVAAFAAAHPMDHYGQMVEYLRMNNIVPPASRPQPKK